MAGSYRHITKDDGTFAGTSLLDHMGDAYEALQECHYMISWLAHHNRHLIEVAIDVAQRACDEPISVEKHSK